MGIQIEDNTSIFIQSCRRSGGNDHDPEDMKFILTRLNNRTYQEWGLKVNFNKTEYMAINTNNFRIQDQMQTSRTYCIFRSND